MLHVDLGRDESSSNDVLSQVQRENHVENGRDDIWVKILRMLEPAPIDKGHS